MLIESNAGMQNKHLEHIEDLPLNVGVRGTQMVLSILRGYGNILRGRASKRFGITMKWDGAPSVFAGTDPETGKFFVATKGIFAKTGPRVAYTDEDVQELYGHSPELASKMSDALRYLPGIGIQGVLQGDLMFTQDSLKDETIDGTDYVVFRPNTIAYAVPADSRMAARIRRAKIGVVWHTQYSGKTLSALKGSFLPDIGRLKKTQSVWFQDASLPDYAGVATFTEQESKAYWDLLREIEAASRSSMSAVAAVASDEGLSQDVKTYVNSQVRQGRYKPTGRGFTKWVRDRGSAAADQLKTDAGKESAKLRASKDEREAKRNEGALDAVFGLQQMVVNAKGMVLSKLQAIQTIPAFVPTPAGYEVAKPEGFVVIDHFTKAAVKLVDRLDFSYQNFTAAKEWSK